MATNMEFILDRLDGVKSSGSRKDQWTALCPAHDDGKASLSVGVGKDGRRLLKCQARCSTEDVVSALDLTMSDLFPTVEDVYDYFSIEDELLYQVVRMRGDDGEKTFRQRSLDEHGDLRWGRGGADPILYRTPEVKEAVKSGDTIYVVEGERDVHSLEGLDKVATCNPGGAGKWKQIHTEALVGAKRVIVVADLDGPSKNYVGERHAMHVAESLREAGVEVSVKQPALGKDVSDHLTAGKTLAELEAFVPPSMDENEATPEKLRFRVLSDVDMLSLPNPEWLIDGLLMAGGFSELWGLWGAGKSFLALDWAMHLATEREWHGRELKAGRPVYVIGEGGLGFKLRIEAWRQRHGVTGPTGAVFVPEPVNLMSADDVEEFLANCLSVLDEPPALFVFDTLNRCMPGGKENSQDDMGRVVANCGWLQRETGAHVLLLHHPGYQTDRGRGSSVLPGALDTILGLENEGGLLRLRCDKQKDAEPAEPAYLRLARCADSLVVEAVEEVTLARRIYDFIRDNPGCGFNVIREGVGAKTKTVQKVIGALVEDGLVHRNELASGHEHFVQPELTVEGQGKKAVITIRSVA